MPTIRFALDRARAAVARSSAAWNNRASRALLRPTLGDVAVGRDNNLNLLRFIAASMVLFSHCYPLSGHIDEEPLAHAVGFTDFGTVGVVIFFGISGFLIAQSLTRSRSILWFVSSRALRLLPALIFSTTFCVFVIGPIATDLPQRAYWADARTWVYFFHTVALDPQVELPGVFGNNALPRAINGSLWTIPLEVWCYGVLALASILGLVRRRWAFTLALVAMGFAFAGMETFVRKHVPSGSTFTSPYLVATFRFGAWLYLYRGVVPVSVASTMVVLVLCVLALSTSLVRYGFFGGIAYLALFLAYHPKLSVRWFLRLGDYSYGIYVFAFPVQQFLVWWLHVHTPLTLFALAFPATLAMAIVSWHLIERPALALKRSGAFSLPFTEAPETKKARESNASPEG